MSSLPARLPRSAARHIGFLNYNRKLLTLGAIAACGVLMSIPSLPASAEVVQDEVEVSTLQTFEAPAIVPVAVVRDAFGFSTFTLVQWPVPSTTTMSDDFGYRSCAGCSTDHKGIDLTPGLGYPIQSVADGIVTQAASDSSDLGVHIVVEHVIDGVTYSSLYAHMLAGSLTLNVGDTVGRGQQLGLVGDTGSSTGPHLHFGILSNGVEIDPEAWLYEHANS